MTCRNCGHQIWWNAIRDRLHRKEWPASMPGWRHTKTIEEHAGHDAAPAWPRRVAA